MKKTSMCFFAAFCFVAFFSPAHFAFEGNDNDMGLAISGPVPVSPPMEEEGDEKEQWDFETLKGELENLKELLESIPESEGAQRLKKSLESLGEEIKRLEKSFREALEKEIIPWIKREIERLKKELYRYLEEPEDNSPRKVEVFSHVKEA
jgi:hypothetical protein